MWLCSAISSAASRSRPSNACSWSDPITASISASRAFTARNDTTDGRLDEPWLARRPDAEARPSHREGCVGAAHRDEAIVV